MEFQLSYFKSWKMMLWKCCTQYASKFWKTQQWSQDWKSSVVIPIPKKGNAKDCSRYRTIALISHSSKVILKILQARLQQYVNFELPMFKLVLEKAEEAEVKLPTSAGSWKKQESSRKTSAAAAAVANSLQSCPTLCDPMDCSTPGLPVHHQVPEFIQTHVHWGRVAI